MRNDQEPNGAARGTGPPSSAGRYTKVDPLGCHLAGSTKPNGYGQLTFRMRRVMGNRLAWMARHGPIPKGLEVCHRCDERRCCNPDHLFLGSHAENMADLRIKRRARRRIPLEPFPRDIRAADMAPIQIFIGGREYVGRAVVRPFDPSRMLKLRGPGCRSAPNSSAKRTAGDRRNS
jgi:hypothetical protein